MNKKNLILPETLSGLGILEQVALLNDETEWLAEGFMTEPTITMIYGTDGLGKSFVGFQNAVDLASGLPLYDVFTVAKARKVIYCVAERSIKEPLKRLKDMLGTERYKDSFLAQNLSITTAFQGRDISNKAMADLLMAKLLHISEAMGGAEVVYFDPLYALVKGDLKSDEAINGVFDFFRRVGNELGASVVFIHHENRGTREAGEKERTGQDYYGNKFISGLCTSVYHMKKNGECRTMLLNEKDTDRVLAPRVDLEYHPEIHFVKAVNTSSPALRDLAIKKFLMTAYEEGRTFSADEIFDKTGVDMHPVNRRKLVAGWVKSSTLTRLSATGTKGIYKATGKY